MIKIKILVHPAESGYWCEVPGLDGCVTQAETLTELFSNAKEAIAGCLGVEFEEGALELVVAAELKSIAAPTPPEQPKPSFKPGDKVRAHVKISDWFNGVIAAPLSHGCAFVDSGNGTSQWVPLDQLELLGSASTPPLTPEPPKRMESNPW